MDELRGKYDNQYIAVKNTNVVADDNDLQEVIEKLEEKEINTRDTPVESISKKPSKIVA